jgi:hypothetical protein
MNNPFPFIVILDDPECDDPNQMAAIIAADLGSRARLAVCSPMLRTETVPAGCVTGDDRG